MATLDLTVAEMRALLERLDLPTEPVPGQTMGASDDYDGISPNLRAAWTKLDAAHTAACTAPVMPRMSCGCPIDAHSDTVNVGMGPGTGATCGRGWPTEKTS